MGGSKRTGGGGWYYNLGDNAAETMTVTNNLEGKKSIFRAQTVHRLDIEGENQDPK